jgi:hypothetical protein
VLPKRDEVMGGNICIKSYLKSGENDNRYLKHVNMFWTADEGKNQVSEWLSTFKRIVTSADVHQ